jgi:hypothetical protein
MLAASNMLMRQGVEGLRDISGDKSFALSIQAGKAGVDFQRKALGLADKKIQVEFGYAIMSDFLTIVQKYVPEIDRLRNIRIDFEARMIAENDELRQLIENMPKDVEETANKIIELRKDGGSEYLRWLYAKDIDGKSEKK